jgi:hypothetical protein
MNKYRVTIARLETRVYHFDIEAKTEEDARCFAWDGWANGEVELIGGDEGRSVHAEEWIQDLKLIKEQAT